MAKGRGIENISKDLTGNLERDLNILVRGILSDLSSRGKSISPIDTGFFMSSWTASTQRPRPNQAREDHAPWSEIEPSLKRRPADNALVEPRFINKIKFNFKLFSKVYIGNRSEYAASALGSTRSQIPQYVQEKIRPLINATFTEKKPRIGIGSKRLEGGKGIGPFADPDREFVDYTNL